MSSIFFEAMIFTSVLQEPIFFPTKDFHNENFFEPFITYKISPGSKQPPYDEDENRHINMYNGLHNYVIYEIDVQRKYNYIGSYWLYRILRFE